MNYVNVLNRPTLKEALELMKAKPCGSWCLVHALESPKEKGQTLKLASKCHYIVFEDRNNVMFYTDNLTCDPMQNIHEQDDNYAMTCAHDRCELDRWKDDRSMTRERCQVPCLVQRYNVFMNAVDKLDQKRTSGSLTRKGI